MFKVCFGAAPYLLKPHVLFCFLKRYLNPMVEITDSLDERGAYSWLEPRLTIFRTLEWQARYRRHERAERLRLPNREVEMMYFAERPMLQTGEQCLTSSAPPSLTVLALQNTLIRVLAGSVYVSSSRGHVLTEDTCLLARGLIQVRAVSRPDKTAPAPAPALWTIRNVDHQVVVDPIQHGPALGDHRLIIKKIFNCTETYVETVFRTN